MNKEQLEQIKERWKYEDYKDVDDLINEVERLQGTIEKIKPFMDMYNQTFGTNMVIGNDEFQSTFTKYCIVPAEEYIRMQIALEED